MAKWIKYQILCNEKENILLDKKLEYNNANLMIAENEAHNGYEIIEDDRVLEKEPLAIELGGTDAKTAEQAREKLGAAPVIQLVTIVGTDLNDYKEEGEYYFNVDSTPIGMPEGVNGWLSVRHGTDVDDEGIWWDTVKQVWHRLGTINSNDHRTFVRTYLEKTGWSNWVRYTTSKDFCGKLTDLGITEFPTTMKIVSEVLPAHGMLILDSRDIITTTINNAPNEISDLGLDKTGVYVFMKGNTPSRFALLRIYSSAQGTTASMDFGGYSTTNNTVQWSSVAPAVATSGIYIANGEIATSNGTTRGAGTATIYVSSDGFVRVDYVVKIHTAGSTNSTSVGLDVDLLRTINPNIPDFIPLDGGDCMYFGPERILAQNANGYGGTHKRWTTRWCWARVHKATGTVGVWTDSLFTGVDAYIRGTCYGKVK